MFTCIRDSVGGVNVVAILQDSKPVCTISVDYPLPYYNAQRIPRDMAEQINNALTTLSAIDGDLPARVQTITNIVKGFNT